MPIDSQVYHMIGDDEFVRDTKQADIKTGWVDADKIQRLGFPPTDSVVWACGVDDMFAVVTGSRMNPLMENSALYQLVFTDATNVWRVSFTWQPWLDSRLRRSW